MEYLKVDNIYSKLLKINLILNENLSSIAKNFNLNSTEFMIYLDIKTHENTNLNSLCERLGLKKSSASKAINKMIENNLVVSKPDEIDQRKVSLIALKPESLPCKEETLEKTFKGLSKSCDLNKIEESLDELLDILTE